MRTSALLLLLFSIDIELKRGERVRRNQGGDGGGGLGGRWASCVRPSGTKELGRGI